ncbi:DUF4097 family beta strand repeat-containing protein [Sulfobacillus harzensis]|uniref:DUF4097 domain-containing protein n=1 Tax=Sulfobacillus harzensis TaxID=2729629 RepID=A0A7Y0L3Y1_9FIRM|nr:DUF4097 family beta strand repeat-containing protein [Sulfobacillus harzensis]NMP22857.1 hypothetical protein [Sulfobacillus harzensis]
MEGLAILLQKPWMILGAVPIFMAGCGQATIPIGPATVAVGAVRHITRVVGSDPHITVSGGGVNVAVTSAVGKTLSLTYQLPKRGRVTIVHRRSWIIQVHLPPHINTSGKAYLHLRVPTTASLNGATAGGNLSAEGMYRRVSLESTGGNLDGTHLITRSLIAQSQGGTISVSWSKPPADVKLESQGGNIVMTGPWSPSSFISSTGGDIHVTGNPTVRTVVRLTAAGGNLSSGFSPLASANSVSGPITAAIGPQSTVTRGVLVVHAAGGDIFLNP